MADGMSTTVIMHRYASLGSGLVKLEPKNNRSGNTDGREVRCEHSGHSASQYVSNLSSARTCKAPLALTSPDPNPSTAQTWSQF